MQIEEMKPMMSDAEIRILHKYLSNKKHCLEWGSGGSTIFFPKLHSRLNWLAVEHNGNWVKDIQPHLPNNANVVWVPENEWYVDCVKHSRIFDFILIDGLHRERCLEIAVNIISDDGVILLHDSGRQEYQDFIKKYKGEKLIDGEEPYRGYYKHRGLHIFRRQSGA